VSAVALAKAEERTKSEGGARRKKRSKGEKVTIAYLPCSSVNTTGCLITNLIFFPSIFETPEVDIGKVQ
jgi:hypothetical protein